MMEVLTVMGILMSSRFSDFDRMISEFMIEFGWKTTYFHKISESVNDTTNVITPVFEEIEIEAIKMELVRPVEGSSGNKAGSLIQNGDQMLYIRPTEKADVFADAVAIGNTADRIDINGKMWKIVTCKSYDPSATDCVLYELYIRK
jgi:hypothetical protein